VVDYVRFNDKFPWPVRPRRRWQFTGIDSAPGDNRQPFNWRRWTTFEPGQTQCGDRTQRTSPDIQYPPYTPLPSASTSEQQTDEKTIVQGGRNMAVF
jgi:hypothetical protein